MGWTPGDAAERAALSFCGIMLLASAGLAARLAAQHVQSLGAVCGAAAAHCAWCPASAALAIAGLTALAFALRPRLAPRRAG